MADKPGDNQRGSTSGPAYAFVDGPPISPDRHMILGEIAQELAACSFTVAADNPAGLTAQEIEDFKTYRKAWVVLSETWKPTEVFNGTDERVNNVAPNDIPLPDGWCYTSRCVGELPKILCRIADLDIEDNTTAAFYEASTSRPKFVCMKPDDFLQFQNHVESMG